MPAQTSDIQFHRLDTEEQVKAWKLDEFSATFGHTVERQFPIWIGTMDGKLAAYAYLHSHVVCYPAITPSLSPREFYELAWNWFAQLKQAYGDPLIVVSQPGKERIFNKTWVTTVREGCLCR